MIKFVSFLCLLGAFYPQAILAERVPSWELGVAAIGASIPYYRGSSDRKPIVFPAPLALVHKKGIASKTQRSRLFGIHDLRMSLSVSAGLPVPEEVGNGLREGMGSLDAMLELGPEFHYLAFTRHKHKFYMNFPLRVANIISWNNTSYKGLVFAPYVSYVLKNRVKNSWNIEVSLGPQFASRSYHSYYYDISAREVKPNRREFHSDAGYSGSRLTIFAKKRFDRLWLSSFARYDTLKKAGFENSALVERDNVVTIGLIAGWVMRRSPH